MQVIDIEPVCERILLKPTFSMWFPSSMFREWLSDEILKRSILRQISGVTDDPVQVQVRSDFC